MKITNPRGKLVGETSKNPLHSTLVVGLHVVEITLTEDPTQLRNSISGQNN